MIRSGVLILAIISLVPFSEEKPCPEQTRPHKTRCEIFYKCIETTPGMQVWVPKKCEKGLVYEPELRICVMPGDDWECIIGEEPKQETAITFDDYSTSRTKGNGKNVITNQERMKSTTITTTTVYNDIEVIPKDRIDSQKQNLNNISEYDEYEASGDGNEHNIIKADGFLEAENRKRYEDNNESELLESTSERHSVPMHEFEGVENPNKIMHLKTEAVKHADDQPVKTFVNDYKPSSKSEIDPKLTRQLQRLSQLIDGLKLRYQLKNTDQKELRPHQLNAYLAHFDIKNKFDSFRVGDISKEENNYQASSSPKKRPALSGLPDTTLLRPLSSESALNLTNIGNSQSDTKMQPETKGGILMHYDRLNYPNHIILEKPPTESTLYFNVPNGGHYDGYISDYSIPKISEETLHTVMELSKQMVANQNIPQILPNVAATYYSHPLLQSIVLPRPPLPSPPPPPSTGTSDNALLNYYASIVEKQGYGATSPPSYSKLPKKPSSGYSTHQSNGNTGSTTTIIHNNLLPVHLSSSIDSNRNDILDSYGQTIYPPLSNSGNNHHHSHRIDTNDFIITTSRPTLGIGMSTTTVYPSKLSVTTSRPIHFNPASVAEFYTPSPHLSDSNVNDIFQLSNSEVQSNAGASVYNLPRPIDINRSHLQRPINISSLFPSQLNPIKVNIRPNSEKIESMEMLDKTYSSGPAYDDYIGDFGSSGNTVENNYISHSGSVTANNFPGGSVSDYNNLYIHRPRPTTMNGNYVPGLSFVGGSGHNSLVSNQLVNIGGNFISYEVFQNSILPLLAQTGQSLPNLNNIEIITCAPGIRQANQTDCTRYYVCSRKDGKVLSYSCPPYTAFNKQTRICDALTFSVCSDETKFSAYGNADSEKRRTQLEAIKAIHEANRRRQQNTKIQNYSNLLNQYSGNSGTDSNPIEENLSGIQQATIMTGTGSHGSGIGGFIISSTTTARPFGKKRKYYCKEGDKIADQTSIFSYFVCYKNAQGMMKGHKMTCSKGLVFCSKSTMCTLPVKCTA